MKKDLKKLQQKQGIEEEKLNFYMNILPKLVGKVFHVPRSYGHAKYEILGGHEEWKKHRDAQKIYFHFDENGSPVATGNRITQKTLCISIKRLGGYDEPAKVALGDITKEALEN